MEPENIANKGEAEKCRDMAKTFLTKGEYEKAAKFFDKSHRLFPLPGVTALKEKALSMAKEASQRNHAGSTGSTGSSNRSSSGDNNHSSSSSSNNSNSGNLSSRPFTPEQEEGAKKILKVAKKSHYEVLGVPKSATDADIKKAYRKLALKFHPDKNSAPSAEGAFKSISGAFDCLSDPAKREAYDQYGHDSDQPSSGGGGGGGGFRHHGGQAFGQDISPEDLFNMFFTGGGHRFRQQHQQQQQRPQQQRRGPFAGNQPADQTAEGANVNQLFQLLPILLLILMTFSSFGGGGSQSPFSLQPQGSYQIMRNTLGARGAVKGLPYYVNSKFRETYSSAESVYRVEKLVESTFKEDLSGRCHQEQDIKRQKILQARYRRASKEDTEKAKNLPTPSCDEYTERFIEKRARQAAENF